MSQVELPKQSKSAEEKTTTNCVGTVRSTELTRLSDDAVTEVYSFLQMAEYHNLSRTNRRFLQLTKTRPVQTSPRYVQVRKRIPEIKFIDFGTPTTNPHFIDDQLKAKIASANRNAERKFALNLRPRALKIEDEVTEADCKMLEKIVPTLESLSLLCADPIHPYFSAMTRLTTLHLNICSATHILEDLPASLTSLSVDREACREIEIEGDGCQECPLHRSLVRSDALAEGEGTSTSQRGCDLTTPNGLRLVQNLLELNLRAEDVLFTPPIECVNLTKLTFEVGTSDSHFRTMSTLASSFSKLTTLNLLLVLNGVNNYLHLDLLSQISTLRQLKLATLNSVADEKGVSEKVSEQLRKIIQLTSFHYLALPNENNNLDLSPTFRHPNTLTNLQELKLNRLDQSDLRLSSSNISNLSEQLTSFGCPQMETLAILPCLDKLAHLDFSSQYFYTAESGVNSGNCVTRLTVAAVKKYANTIKQVIVPDSPATNVDTNTNVEFLEALSACPLLREVVLPVVWGKVGSGSNTNIRQSFVEKLLRQRPDIQLRCQK